MTDENEMKTAEINRQMNARTVAVDRAVGIAAHNNKIGAMTIDTKKVIEDAKLIEAFILGEQVSTTQA